MTSLRQWRHIIAKQVAAYLSTDERPIPGYQTPHQRIDLPAVVVWPGGIDDYLGIDVDGDPGTSWWAQEVNTTIGFVAGHPSEAAYDLLDEWLDLLPAALESVTTDEWWSPLDAAPVVTRVPSYSLIEIGGGPPNLASLVQVTGIRQSHNHE